jgi:hypothetical protein
MIYVERKQNKLKNCEWETIKNKNWFILQNIMEATRFPTFSIHCTAMPLFTHTILTPFFPQIPI